MFRNSLIQKYVEAYSKYYIYDSIADGFMQTDVCMQTGTERRKSEVLTQGYMVIDVDFVKEMYAGIIAYRV